MANVDIGSEQFTDEDRRYAGSRFREVVDALFANPYQAGVGSRGRTTAAGSEPDDQERLRRAALSVADRPDFEGASDADARLRRRPSLGTGSERLRAAASSERRLPRRALADHRRHAVLGVLRARQDGARRGPLLEWRREASLRGHVRSLALVGKLFPTTDPDHPTPLRTANFITQEDIGGARSDVDQRR